jgi:hypothetical protein
VYKTTICLVKFRATITKHFKNGVLGRIFGHKRGIVTGGWKKVDTFHNLNRAANTVTVTKSMRMKRTRYAAGKTDAGNAYKILAETFESTGLPERSGRKGYNNIKIYLKNLQESCIIMKVCFRKS